MSTDYWKGPFYAVTSLGRARWFWATWANYDQAYHDGYGVTGYAETRELAVTDALAVEPTAHPWPAVFAAQLHRRLAVERRATRSSTTTTTGALEFVWSSYFSDFDNTKRWTRHRIVKKTKTRIYAEKRVYRDDQQRFINTEYGTPDSYDIPTFVIDRAEMECTGSSWSRTMRERFYLAPENAYAHDYSPSAIVALGLSLPCSVEEVKRAYRQLSRVHHPDAGGDSETFIALQSAYEQALTYVTERIAA